MTAGSSTLTVDFIDALLDMFTFVPVIILISAMQTTQNLNWSDVRPRSREYDSRFIKPQIVCSEDGQ